MDTNNFSIGCSYVDIEFESSNEEEKYKVHTPGGIEDILEYKLNGLTYVTTTKLNRSGNTKLASDFNDDTGGKGHITTFITKEDKEPNSLNLYFKFIATFTFRTRDQNGITDVSKTATFFAGQGHTGKTNNWWVGNKETKKVDGKWYYYDDENKDKPVLSLDWHGLTTIHITNLTI